nr:hypothetical protein CFP56_02647 [Quercus suber]
MSLSPQFRDGSATGYLMHMHIGGTWTSYDAEFELEQCSGVTQSHNLQTCSLIPSTSSPASPASARLSREVAPSSSHFASPVRAVSMSSTTVMPTPRAMPLSNLRFLSYVIYRGTVCTVTRSSLLDNALQPRGLSVIKVTHKQCHLWEVKPRLICVTNEATGLTTSAGESPRLGQTFSSVHVDWEAKGAAYARCQRTCMGSGDTERLDGFVDEEMPAELVHWITMQAPFQQSTGAAVAATVEEYGDGEGGRVDDGRGRCELDGNLDDVRTSVSIERIASSIFTSFAGHMLTHSNTIAVEMAAHSQEDVQDVGRTVGKPVCSIKTPQESTSRRWGKDAKSQMLRCRDSLSNFSGERYSGDA